MTAQARLQRITQGLSALQRIQLLLQAQREGRELDPELSRISDPQQNKAFNRYVALIHAINESLGALCHAESAFSRVLDDSANQVRLLEQAARLLETDLGSIWSSARAIGVPPARCPSPSSSAALPWSCAGT